MKLEIIRPDIGEKYVGKTFRYHSKYGGTIENIICEDVSVKETIEYKNGESVVTSVEISIISDKRNSYDLNEVEFYEKVD